MFHPGHCVPQPRDGSGSGGCAKGHDAVIGAVNVYEKGGALSFIIEQLFSQGTGSLQAQYERIKNELAAQGYFDSSHKKELPRFPWRVGVLTSKTGAVLHDVYKIAGERNPYADIVLHPIPVQGDGVDTTIAAAIEAMGRRKDLDVLIVGRGGGSMEDLWCFNSPAVVKAIYGAKVPVITAIGHETDTTLADYAADVRAATPTHAAEMAFFDVREAELDLAALADRAYERVMACIEDRQRLVEQAAGRLNLKRYDAFLAMKETHLSGLMQQAGPGRCSSVRTETGKAEYPDGVFAGPESGSPRAPRIRPAHAAGQNPYGYPQRVSKIRR